MIFFFLFAFIQTSIVLSENLCIDGVCYYFQKLEISSFLTYDDALIKCKNKSLNLAVINNKNIQNQIKNSLNLTGLEDEFYFGLKYITNEKFIWTNGMNNVPDLIWDDSTVKTDVDACAYITNTSKISMGPCSIKRNYICSNNTKMDIPDIITTGYCPPGFFKFLNYCYRLNLKCNDKIYTWYEARAQCDNMSSTLVAIDSFIEEEFITALMTISPQPVWTGIIYKNITKQISLWVVNSTDTMVNYPIKFKEGEPNGHKSIKEHCLMIYSRLANIGYVNDEVCNKSMSFICKTPLLKKNLNPKDDTVVSHPLFKRGSCKDSFYEFNETCYSVQNLNKSYQNSSSYCKKSQMLKVNDNIHIAFMRSLMAYTGVNNLWISIFDEAGKLNGANALVDENDSKVDLPTKDKCYYMDITKGLKTANSCQEINIGTSCYYYLDGHEETTEEFICSIGWKKVGKKCFKLFTEYQTFSQSSSECKWANSKLATITNMKEAQAVDSLLSGNAWLGISGESYLRDSWIDGSSINYCLFRHTTDLRALIESSPKSYCFVIKDKKIEWDDKQCDELYNFVCEMPATKNKCSSEFPIYVDGDCYGSFTKTQNWNEAEKFCQKTGGNNSHLASFHSFQQEYDVFNQINDMNEYFIGLKVIDFKYMWVDGSILNYQRNYASIQLTDDFNCFSSQKTSNTNIDNNRWSKVNCGIQMKFICKVSNITRPNVPKVPNITITGFCPKGFWNFENSCFKLVKENATWNDADKHCKQISSGKNLKARIASFKSREEFEFILSQMRDTLSYVWIGLYKDDNTNQYIWVNEQPLTFLNVLENSYFDNFEIHSGSKVAMLLSSHPFKNGRWSLMSSLTNLPYICRIDAYETSPQEHISEENKCLSNFSAQYNGYCYLYNPVGLTFQEAYDSCQKHGYDLLVLGDTFEEQFIRSFLYDKGIESKLIWMGFKVDPSESMLMNWATPKNKPIYYTHWKNVIEYENNRIYTDENPQSNIHGCYSLNFSSDFNIFNDIDRNVINNAMIKTSCEILIPSICKTSQNSKIKDNFETIKCAKSANNISYELDVTKTKQGDQCIRWDIAKPPDGFTYHLRTFLYSSAPFNKDGYISYSLNRCSESKFKGKTSAYNCYIFKDGKYLLEECEMIKCGATTEAPIAASSNKTILIILFIMTIIILFSSILFLFRKRILSNYRIRSFLAHSLGRYQPDWLGDSHRPHTSTSGGVGFSNPIYTPLESKY